MKPHQILFFLAFFLIVAAIALIIVFKQEYDLVRWEDQGDTRCTTVFERCTCYGFLTTYGSAPPSYMCNGHATCATLNETTCEPRNA